MPLACEIILHIHIINNKITGGDGDIKFKTDVVIIGIKIIQGSYCRILLVVNQVFTSARALL